MNKEELVLEKEPIAQQAMPTHFALPIDTFNEVLELIGRFPYLYKLQIEKIEKLIKDNALGVSLTKTNTDDKQN